MDLSASPAPDACPSRSVWSDFALGRTSPERQATLAAHLETCANCQRIVADVSEQSTDDPIVRHLRHRQSNEPAGSDGPTEDRTDAFGRLSTTAHEGDLFGTTFEHDRLPEGTTLGQFEIRRVLGEGGFGIVYLAFDRRLQREVALKLPKRPRLLDPTSCARLIWEAQASARLSHPNLLPVYEAGEIEGTTFIASAYCPGPTLSRWLEDCVEVPPIDDAVRLITSLADAVEYAHGRGILHRDIKPDNVLLEPVVEGGLLGGADGTGYIPKLTDFGLAKCVEADTDLAAELQSRSGVAFGTPAYMAPEQAGGHRDRVDVRTDVYALGAMLYRVLCGRPPIRGDSALDTLRRIETDEPVPLRQIESGIPRDVQTICLKCLEKQQDRRYASARDLAADLRLFLAGKSITARPAGPIERMYRTARRRPAAAALLLVMVLGAMTSMVALSVHTRQLGSALARIETSERTARTLLYASLVSQAWDSWQNRDFVRAGEFLEASHNATNGDVGGPADLRGFEWHLLAGLTPPHLEQTTIGSHEGGTTCVRFAPSGRLLASAGVDGIVRLWNMPSGTLQHVLEGHEGDVNRIEFSPDGRQLATASDDGTVRLWNVASGTAGHVLRGHDRRVFEVVWAGDGLRLASAGDGWGIRIWDVASGERLGTLPAQDVTAMAFWPGTSRLVSVEQTRELRVIDFATLRQVASHDVIHPRPVEQIVFSDDGSRMLTASRDGTVREWALATFQLLTLFQGHLDAIHDTVYLNDADLIATASRDRTIRLWERSGRQMSVIRGHSDCVWSVDLAPDGTTLATGARDGTVRLCRWQDWLHNEEDRILARPLSVTEHSVAFSPDGRQLAAVAGNRDLILLAADDLTEKGRFAPVSDMDSVVTVTFSPDGAHVMTGSLEGQLVVWNLRDGASRTHQIHTGHIFRIVFAPDGKSFATCGQYGELRLWSWPEVERIANLKWHAGWVLSACFSPDGETLVSSGSDGTAVQWDVESKTPWRVLRKHTGWVRDVAISPDGRLIATAGNEGTVNQWDARDGTLLRTLSLTDEQVFCLAFTPDGRTIVTGGSQTVRFWQTQSGQQLTVFRYPDYGEYRAVSFSPDGQLLVAVAGKNPWNSVLRMWSCGDRTARTPGP
ncbi:Serine/threonine-protein kinase PknB [Maioricimonas rarisocia]|uniref:Serine/threonine-protein kinase PknB n=1 Tax=Maioricimonas rarisocia TaxID=2528026 RepID=A0A517Z822_9PLAN|nr:protein kinase [Maioricimonas rarisocia]QDU38624.1 Serine/threonine-protein kinase PknB [Maioricimonas rarisocia]